MRAYDTNRDFFVQVNEFFNSSNFHSKSQNDDPVCVIWLSCIAVLFSPIKQYYYRYRFPTRTPLIDDPQTSYSNTMRFLSYPSITPYCFKTPNRIFGTYYPQLLPQRHRISFRVSALFFFNKPLHKVCCPKFLYGIEKRAPISTNFKCSF